MKDMIYYRKGILDFTSEGWEVVYDNPVSGDNRVWFEEERITVSDTGGIELAQGKSVYFTKIAVASGKMTAVLAEKPITKSIVKGPTGIQMEFEVSQEWSAEFRNGYTKAIEDIRDILQELEKEGDEFTDQGFV